MFVRLTSSSAVLEECVFLFLSCHVTTTPLPIFTATKNMESVFWDNVLEDNGRVDEIRRCKQNTVTDDRKQLLTINGSAVLV